jgi:hypothetical protein
VPQTKDGEIVALLIKRIEAALSYIKMTCKDFEQEAGVAINLVNEIAREFNEVAESISLIAKSSYYPPKGMNTIAAADAA